MVCIMCAYFVPREREITALSWSELEAVDLVEQVFFVMKAKLVSQHSQKLLGINFFQSHHSRFTSD